MLSKELVKELQTIIREDYGPTLPEDLVEKVGIALTDFSEILAEMDQLEQPIKENYYDNNPNHTKGQ